MPVDHLLTIAIGRSRGYALQSLRRSVAFTWNAIGRVLQAIIHACLTSLSAGALRAAQLRTQTAAFQVWCANSPSRVSWTRCLTLIAPESNVHIHSLVAESAVLTSI